MPVEAFASGDKTGWTHAWDLFYDERQQATDTARALASVASDKKVALFTDSDPGSVVERPLYEAAFKAAGLDVVGDYTFPAGTADFSSFIADARAAGAQLLAGQLTQADGVALSKQLTSFRPKAAFLAVPADGYWSASQASPGQLATISSTLGKKYAPAYPEISGGEVVGRAANKRSYSSREYSWSIL
jgi:branched-chain amino acid transport system substrate-binding protein